MYKLVFTTFIVNLKMFAKSTHRYVRPRTSYRQKGPSQITRITKYRVKNIRIYLCVWPRALQYLDYISPKSALTQTNTPFVSLKDSVHSTKNKPGQMKTDYFDHCMLMHANMLGLQLQEWRKGIPGIQITILQSPTILVTYVINDGFNLDRN